MQTNIFNIQSTWTVNKDWYRVYGNCLTYMYLIISCVIKLDHSKGFGGKYGVQKEKMDKVPSSIYAYCLIIESSFSHLFLILTFWDKF